jgi:chemotaxis protein methyltransferase CheR
MSDVLRLNDREFDRLRVLIEGWCGIALDGTKSYLVEARLRHLAVELGCATYMEFFERVRDARGELRDQIVDCMTTNETSWFRDRHFYDAVREQILPEVVERVCQDGRRRVRIWSAACSTGQEPYSLAILLLEMERRGELQGLGLESFGILATDICQSALILARRARYDPISMRRGLDPALRDRYFELDGRVAVLRDEVRKAVRFERFNLLDPMSGLGSFDLIFMRNVMIYFSRESKQRVLSSVLRVLRPESPFAVGVTETLELYTKEFDAVRSGSCTYYRAKER